MGTKTNARTGFHAKSDYSLVAGAGWWTYRQDSAFTYEFENFFHPFVGELIEQLNLNSLSGMLDPAFQAGLTENFFATAYALQTSRLVKVASSPKEIDVAERGPYAYYNWELLFHIPLAIAVHLSKNQRFAEAQRWFHFIFDPTATDAPWRFIAFRNGSAGEQIGDLLALLSKPDDECTSDELPLRAMVLAGYEAIKATPFQPHAVARTRHVAYMYSVAMKYLDNLVAWGDQLFRQDSLESINEATQLYVLAANILGDRPQKIPATKTVRPKTFGQLREQGLDAMGNTLVELEGQFPFNSGVPTGTEDADASAALVGIGRTLYFCIPRNDKLLGYWDTVADRLFKIRHCMNIEGVVRPLALFDPPLDPGMLVKAAAAGIDIGAIVAGLNQPVSPVRAQLLIQKALELAAEVRGLGSSLLQAIEKGDGEGLALLRQGHEIKINRLQVDVRFLQWKQAQEATESLLRTRAVTLERYKYYLRLLGQTPDANLAPDTLPLDRRELTEENFDEAYAALVGQYEKEVPVLALPPLTPEGGGSPAGGAGATGPGKLFLTTSESDEIDNLRQARNRGLAASIVDATGASMVFIPDIKANLHYMGIGCTSDIPVGTALQKVLEITARGLNMSAAWYREQAGIVSRTATYERRADDWIFQANVAARELRQTGRQVLASLIAEQIAHREYETVTQQIDQAQEVDRFLREKFSNAELYGWMQGELSRLYYEYYRFAFDVARKAEQTLKRELMRPELDNQTLVKFNYWDGGRKGLLSGEALYLDVKRMEIAYQENNRREYELTKHVSLMQVDPLALVSLRATGSCKVRLPEALFDLDGPGHYFRRIKSVALSIPCVTGPYAGVNCKLTLFRSSVRTSPLVPNDAYVRDYTSVDTRFQDYAASVQSVVASSAQQDSGLFETNIRDERYLPFENAGVVDSEWQLELPANPSRNDPTQFDYDTIADVILHIRYTARDGGANLRDAAIKEPKNLIDRVQAAGAVRLFSMRHEFPTEWAQFTNQTPSAGRRYELAVKLRPEHFPFWSQSLLNSVVRVDLFAQSTEDPVAGPITVADSPDARPPDQDTLTETPSLDHMLVGKLDQVPLPDKPIGDLKLYFDDNQLSDLWIALTWSGPRP
jgi:hypothetical protein